MSRGLALLTALAPGICFAQSGIYAYNPAQNSFFKLKSAKVESTVIGPMVRTCTDLIYANPYGASTVSLNFGLTSDAVLAGFGYADGDRYLSGRLVPDSQAWANYTGIKNRTPAPGMLAQSSSAVYNAQISPLKLGNDLHVRLWTVGMLQPSGDEMFLPKPEVATSAWTARSAEYQLLKRKGTQYSAGPAWRMQAIAQKFTDGRYYVAGYVHVPKTPPPTVEVEHAYYEPASGQPGGADVTAKVAGLVKSGKLAVWASDTTFGDPCPYVVKRLRVVGRFDGLERTLTVAQDGTLSLFGQGGPSKDPVMKGILDYRFVFLDAGTVAFSGWVRSIHMISASFAGHHVQGPMMLAPNGSDAARLWAQQMVASQGVFGSDQVRQFSLKYGIPSNVTSMIAETQPELAQFNANQEALPEPEWAMGNAWDWKLLGRYGPGFKVEIPQAEQVAAKLPDGKTVYMVPNGDVWTASFPVPSVAPQGLYKILLTASMRGGSTAEKEVWFRLPVLSLPPVPTEGDVGRH